MARLPEAEVLRKEIEKRFSAKRLTEVSVDDPSLLVDGDAEAFAAALKGRRLTATERRGATIMGALDDDTLWVLRPSDTAVIWRRGGDEVDEAGLVAQFGRTGALYVSDPDGGTLSTVARREDLNATGLVPTEGLDPFAESVTWISFGRSVHARTEPLRAILGDGSLVPDIGDVYADEILWDAGLSGTRVAESLSSQEVRRLFRSIGEVLGEGVKQGGISSGEAGRHTDLDGNEGRYGSRLSVYQRAGQPCPRCRETLTRIEHTGGQIAYACPACQT